MDTPYSYGLSRYAGIVVNNSRRVSYVEISMYVCVHVEMYRYGKRL